jgi:hypothetical protein
MAQRLRDSLKERQVCKEISRSCRGARAEPSRAGHMRGNLAVDYHKRLGTPATGLDGVYAIIIGPSESSDTRDRRLHIDA